MKVYKNYLLQDLKIKPENVKFLSVERSSTDQLNGQPIVYYRLSTVKGDSYTALAKINLTEKLQKQTFTFNSVLQYNTSR